MPRYSRRSRRRSGEQLDMIDHLRTGSCMGCLIQPPQHDDAAVKEAWEKSRDIVLRDWILERPGSRPHAWWAFDAPAPGRRERADGRPHPFDNPQRSLAVARVDRPAFWQKAYSLRFGLPGCIIPPFDLDIYHDFMRNTLRGRESEIFEPEWSFLQRHGLLIDGLDSP